METIAIPKYEYLSMQQKITDLQDKVKYLQDEVFMSKLKSFVDLFYNDYTTTSTFDDVNPIPFQFGAAKGMMHISDDFNAPIDEFNEYL